MASGLSPSIRFHGLNSMEEPPRGWASSAQENNDSRTLRGVDQDSGLELGLS